MAILPKSVNLMIWPFIERRRSKRQTVEWNGLLHYHLSGKEERVDVKVSEISHEGARLHLERLQIGPYHLLIGDSPEEFRLSMSLPEGPLTVPVAFRWFNQDEENHRFIVGVEFQELNDEDRKKLRKACQQS